MAMGGGILDFVQRFQSIQAQRDTADHLVRDLLVYSEELESRLRRENAELRQQLNDATLDLVDATKSRRDLQQQLRDLDNRTSEIIEDNYHLKNHNSYIIVLVDGDGLFFKESYVNQGVEGGKKAAYALRAAILQQCGELAKDVEVIAKVYANLSGLSKAMRRDMSLENDNNMRDFSVGFTQAKASFDFIDVGHGKERADSKLKETTRWNLRNYNCKHVVLGISHDAGYAPFLDELFQDESTKRRVTLTEGYPAVRELVATGVRILKLPDLFRTEKLVDKTSHQLNNRPAFSNSTGSPAPGVIGPTSVPSVASTPDTTAASTSTSTPPASTTSSYAHVTGNASPPPQIILPMQPRPANPLARRPTKPVPWNPGPRGLDPTITVSQTALDSIKKRKDSSKLCNNHYLRGPCVKGDSCYFEHKYKPTKDEINAIAYLNRLNPCANGQDCDLEGCIYGHHCPNVRDGACINANCKFEPVDHPPGTKLRSNSNSYDY